MPPSGSPFSSAWTAASRSAPQSRPALDGHACSDALQGGVPSAVGREGGHCRMGQHLALWNNQRPASCALHKLREGFQEFFVARLTFLCMVRAPPTGTGARSSQDLVRALEPVAGKPTQCCRRTRRSQTQVVAHQANSEQRHLQSAMHFHWCSSRVRG